MRGRVRNNYFSVRVDMAQKATFARDAARDRACIYVPLESKKKYAPRNTRTHGIVCDNGFLFHPCGASSYLSGLPSREWIILRPHCVSFPAFCQNCWHLDPRILRRFAAVTLRLTFWEMIRPSLANVFRIHASSIILPDIIIATLIVVAYNIFNDVIYLSGYDTKAKNFDTLRILTRLR